MKQQIRTLAITALFITANAFGQGTVNFVNDSATLSTPPDRLIRFGGFFSLGIPAGTPAYGTNFQVQLYYGASTATAAALIPVSSTPARLRASTTTLAGTWTGGGIRTLTGFDFGSGVVNLQVRVWDINFGFSYEAAIANPAYAGWDGKSPVFQYLIPASSGAPGEDFAMKNFPGDTIEFTPEPSGLALVGLGAGMLLIARRRNHNSMRT